MSSSNTPKTDAVTIDCRGRFMRGEYVPADYARAQEREIARLRAEAARKVEVEWPQGKCWDCGRFNCEGHY